MDWQHLINIGGAAIVGAMGWFARQLWDAVQKLKDDMNRLELHLSNNYMKSQDIRQMFNRIEIQLDKILDKVDQKADK
jgi:Zn-dependent M32 family carboxypeptidase